MGVLPGGRAAPPDSPCFSVGRAGRTTASISKFRADINSRLDLSNNMISFFSLSNFFQTRTQTVSRRLPNGSKNVSDFQNPRSTPPKIFQNPSLDASRRRVGSMFENDAAGLQEGKEIRIDSRSHSEAFWGAKMWPCWAHVDGQDAIKFNKN